MTAFLSKASRWRLAAGSGIAALVVIGCSEDNPVVTPPPPPPPAPPAVELVNRSVTPALLTSLLPNVQIYSLLSSDDVLPDSPGFIFGGSADGSGLMKNPDGTYTALVNNEDNFSVSRIRLDATFKPISGEYVINSTAGKYRLCSATLVTPEIHGFGPLFLTAGESSEESQILAFAPNGTVNTPKYLTGFGRWSAENAVPLPKTAYPGKTVVLIGDDDSGAEGGQLVMYVSSTVGDLDNGKVYVVARNDENVRERDMVVGQSYPVTFREIAGHKAMTGRQLNQATVPLKAIPFGRVEDIDYRKSGAGREVYFNVTGLNNTASMRTTPGPSTAASTVWCSIRSIRSREPSK